MGGGLRGPSVISSGSGFASFSSYLMGSTADESGIASNDNANFVFTETRSAGTDFSLDGTDTIRINTDCWAILWFNYNASADTGVITSEGFQFIGTTELTQQAWDGNFLAAAGFNFSRKVVQTMPIPVVATDQITALLQINTSAGDWTSHGLDPAFAIFRVA